MTPYNHLTDRKLLWLSTLGGPRSSLEIELASRLENAVDYQDLVEERLAALAAKYNMTMEDLMIDSRHDP